MSVCQKEPEDEPVSEIEQVQAEVEHLNTRWNNLTANVKDLTKQLENVEKEVVKTTEKEKVLEDLFKEVEKVLDAQKPVSTNPATCKKECDRIKVLFFIHFIRHVFSYVSHP